MSFYTKTFAIIFLWTYAPLYSSSDSCTLRHMATWHRQVCGVNSVCQIKIQWEG